MAVAQSSWLVKSLRDSSCFSPPKDIAAYRAKGKVDAGKKVVAKAEKSKKKKEEEEDEDEDEEDEDDEEEEEEEDEDDDDE